MTPSGPVAPLQGSAYGLSVRSHLPLRRLLAPAQPALPELTIDHYPTLPEGEDHLDDDHALLTLPDKRRLGVKRSTGQATLYGPTPDTEELAHPLLGSAATVISRWLGREVFHAGSFAHDDKAICILGDNHAGKSTLLSALTARGNPILADDLAFTDGHQVYAGPRNLDLRNPRGASAPLRAVRDNRLRMTLPPCPPQLPLGGWVLLDWDGLSIEPVAAGDLLPALINRRALRRVPSDPQAFLALASQPAWRLRRPPDWTLLDTTIDMLHAAIAAQRKGAV